MGDNDHFPAPVYKDTVLAPLFETVKRHHFAPLLAVDRAHAVMLHECGWLTRDEVRAILLGLADIEARVDPMGLTYTGAFEDLFFVIQDALVARTGADIGGKLHTGRSRNDIDHTLFKLELKRRLGEYRGALLELIATLLDVAERHAATIVVAYTHGQPAQPSTFGHYLAALVEVLQRDAARLAAACVTVDQCSMGAAAITTSGFGLDRARVADLLGFAAVQENAYGAIAACDYITEPYAALRLHCINLGRFVQDLNAWTGFETGHLHVPDGFVQISSIMPQKRNPVPIEHMRLLASLAAGHCETIITTMHNTPFTDMNDAESEVQEAGYAAFETALRVLRLLGGFTASLTVDGAKVARHIDQSCVCITELADSLVRAEGITTRQAHAIASHLAREVIAAGITLPELPWEVFATAFAGAAGRAPAIGLSELRRFATPEHFIAVRTMQGGPAPAAFAASLALYRTRLARDGLVLAEFVAVMARGETRLADAVRELLA